VLAALSYVCSAASAQAACDAAASSNGVRRLPCCIRYLDSVVALQWVSIPATALLVVPSVGILIAGTLHAWLYVPDSDTSHCLCACYC
jgi:hypothetical protein